MFWGMKERVKEGVSPSESYPLEICDDVHTGLAESNHTYLQLRI